MSTPPPSGFVSEESERLRVLHEYGVLDTPLDPVFDDLTSLAAAICLTPISLVSLIDKDRQWFKSHHGLTVRETPRSLSFCSHTVEGGERMVVTDASTDPRFSANPLVTSGPNIRFYAGVPLRTPGGYSLGTLCVIDRKPRQLTSSQLDALEILARQAMSQLELRRALNARSEMEKQYRRLFAANPMPMWVYDRTDFSLLATNEAATTAYGYTRTEFKVMSALDLHAPEEAGRFKTFTAKPADGLTVVSRWRHRKKDGSEIAVDVYAHELVFDGRLACIVQALDRTEEERALSALRQSERRFESVARAVTDLIWDWDLVENTVWRSEGFYCAFGHDAADIESRTWSDRIHVDDRARVVDGIQRAINRGEWAWTEEYRFERKDGTYATVQDRAQILRDESGRAHRMVGGMSDLTERKSLEANYLRSQRMESVGSLAGGMAHDLNNVLSPILLSISMLKDMVTNADGQRCLDAIEASAQHGANLIENVLSFARGREGRRAPTRISRVIADTVQLAQKTFPRSIQINVFVPPDLWLVQGDATQLHQIFMNLLVNARDALKEGGSIFVSAHNEELPEAWCTPFRAKGGSYVVTTVRDTGPGIPADIAERIFEPFFTTKALGSGTGLGLATVHGIVTGHGGFVRLVSAPGEGASFEVCLPAEPQARGEVPVPGESVEVRGSGELILLVDDEPAIRTVGSQTLRSQGYRVVTAEHGRHALEVFGEHQHEIRLVLIDLMMPVMGGAACIVKLTAMNPDLPIVVSSAMHPTSDQLAGATFKHFLPKPYTAATLLRSVRRALSAVPS